MLIEGLSIVFMIRVNFVFQKEINSPDFLRLKHPTTIDKARKIHIIVLRQ